MPSRWLVTYTMSTEVRVEARGDLRYPDLGVTLTALDGLLKTILHELQFEDIPEEEFVRLKSRVHLDQLLAALRYLHLKPLPYWVEATRIDPPETSLKLSVRASGTIGPRSIKTPPVGWNHGAPPQLASWLLLAAEAQETPSAASAIRFYYVILEDLKLQGDPVAIANASALNDVKAVRDFVSHPSITSPSTTATLSACASGLATAQGAYRLDPTSPQQTRILDEWRQKARGLVDAALQRWLPT